MSKEGDYKHKIRDWKLKTNVWGNWEGEEKVKEEEQKKVAEEFEKDRAEQNFETVGVSW